MDYLYRNSVSYQKNQRKSNNQQKHKETFDNGLKKIKLKKWQNAQIQESISKISENIKNEENNLIEKEKKRKEENKKQIIKEIEKNKTKNNNNVNFVNNVNNEMKVNKKVEEKSVVLYNSNETKLNSPVYNQMVTIQYILNTFQMYPEFNIHYYRNNNPDIIHLSNYELVYHWNHYGINEREERIYNEETFFRLKPRYYEENPIYIFMHVCNLHNGVQIFYDQLNSIIESGLYDICKNILVCVVGKSFEIPTNKYNKVLLLYQDDNPKYYEVKTINYIKYIAEKIPRSSRILYIHTKGVRKNGDEVCVMSWRKLLEYWTVVNHDIALQYLQNYDTVGSNVINMCPTNNPETKYLYYVNPKHCFHYSGNFWWATAEHILRLPMLQHDPKKDSLSTRCRAENWILSPLPNMIAFEMYYNKNYVHPYHIYCDPNTYQKKYMEVFSGRNNYGNLRK